MASSQPATAFGLYQRQNVPYSIDTTRQLGSGTYGAVFIGRLQGTEVAFKRSRMPAGHAIDYAPIREASLMASMTHPNVLGILEALVIEESVTETVNRRVNGAVQAVTETKVKPTFYLITELANEGHLRSYVQTRRPTAAQIKTVMYDIALGIEFLHQHNVIHGDLKPENVLVYRRQAGGVTPKLADFGLSEEAGCLQQNATYITYTADFRPPEIFLAGDSERAPTRKCDVWAYLIMFYEMMKGGTPFLRPPAVFPPGYADWSVSVTDPDYLVALFAAFGVPSPTNILRTYHRWHPSMQNIAFTGYPLTGNAEFNAFFYSNIVLDPFRRAGITELIDSPYFNGIPGSQYRVVGATSDANCAEYVANAMYDAKPAITQLRMEGDIQPLMRNLVLSGRTMKGVTWAVLALAVRFFIMALKPEDRLLTGREFTLRQRAAIYLADMISNGSTMDIYDNIGGGTAYPTLTETFNAERWLIWRLGIRVYHSTAIEMISYLNATERSKKAATGLYTLALITDLPLRYTEPELTAVCAYLGSLFYSDPIGENFHLPSTTDIARTLAFRLDWNVGSLLQPKFATIVQELAKKLRVTP